MAEESFETIEQPFAEQTVQNTNDGWLREGMVEVDLEQMSDYAQAMLQIQMYATDHMTRVMQDLSTVPTDAWDANPPPLPEAQYLADKVVFNTGEFNAYLRVLLRSIGNVGMAAQNIADIYRGTDGFGAATLADVQWALDQYGATRPTNAPSWISTDQTAEEKLRADLASNTPPEASPLWTKGSETPIDGGSRVEWNGPNDSRMVVETYSDAYGGPAVRTTTIYDRGGAVVSVRVQTTEVTYADGKVITTVTTTQGGKVQGSVVTEQTYRDGEVVNTTVTQQNATGDTTARTVEVTDREGTTITTYGTDEDGHYDGQNPTRVVAIGADSTTDMPTDPVDVATHDLADPYGTNELERRAEQPHI